MTWTEIEPGVWLDDGRSWSIGRIDGVLGFKEHFRVMSLRTHQRDYFDTLAIAKAFCEVER